MTHHKGTNEPFAFTRTFKEQFDLRIKQAEETRPGLIERFTPLQMKATVAGIIALDDEWGLEYFPMIIEHTIVDFIRLKELGLIVNEEYHRTLAERAHALQDLANELRWIINYGCRLNM